jgi:hypothetical protein
MTNIGIKVGVIALAVVMALAGAFSFGPVGAVVGLVIAIVGVFCAIKLMGPSETDDGRFDAGR